MKNKILASYPHFQIDEYSCDLYVVDYTEITKNHREVEIHTIKPIDIDSFEIKNPTPIETCTIIFNNDSFIDGNGKPLSQCECICFPNTPTETKPWVLFLELKYCLSKNKRSNIYKAKFQLFETMGYFKSKGIIDNHQPCYLIASLPLLNKPPFDNFMFNPTELKRLKIEENVIIRGTNQLTIKNEFLLQV